MKKIDNADVKIGSKWISLNNGKLVTVIYLVNANNGILVGYGSNGPKGVRYLPLSIWGSHFKSEIEDVKIEPIKTRPILMNYCPINGTSFPYPSRVEDFRLYHTDRPWYYDPWTGNERTEKEVALDPYGFLIECNEESYH